MSKAKLRETTLYDIKQRLLLDAYRNCMNCMSFSEEQDKCLKFDAKPPTKILIYSCDAYTDSGEVPF